MYRCDSGMDAWAATIIAHFRRGYQSKKAAGLPQHNGCGRPVWFVRCTAHVVLGLNLAGSLAFQHAMMLIVVTDPEPGDGTTFEPTQCTIASANPD